MKQKADPDRSRQRRKKGFAALPRPPGRKPAAYFYYTLLISCSENSRVHRGFSLLPLRRLWSLGGGAQSWGACVVGAGCMLRRRCPFSKRRRRSHMRSGIESSKSHWFPPRVVSFSSNLGALFLSKAPYFRGHIPHARATRARSKRAWPRGPWKPCGRPGAPPAANQTLFSGQHCPACHVRDKPNTSGQIKGSIFPGT